MLMMQQLVVEFCSYDSGGIASRPLVVISDTLATNEKKTWLVVKEEHFEHAQDILRGQVFKLH